MTAASSNACGTCGGRAGGGGKPPRTGGPHGGVASPWGATICLTPCDRQRPADGCRLTRWADDVVVRCQTREAAQRALAVAARCLRAAVGVEGHPQKTRVVPVSQGVEFLGDQVKQGSGDRLPAHQRRGRSKPQHLEAIPREQAVPRFQEQSRARPRRKVPLKRRELIERITPVMRGWGPCDRKVDVRRRFQRRDRWIAHRLDAFLATRWRHPMWRRYPPRRLLAACGLGRRTHLMPGLVP